MRSMRLLLCIAIFLLPSVCLAKSGPNLHSLQEVARVRNLCGTEDWAIRQREKAVAGAQRWIEMSDEDLWDFILDAEIPRALNVNFGVGCPVHGKEVFQKGGHYPWIMSPDKPFKVTCPVGGEVYPSNDFEAYLKNGRKEKLDTTQPCVDDGFGYIAPDGQRYWFAAHYIFWQRWRRDFLSALNALGNAYLLTGTPEYAHKLGVMLGRLTQVYPRMDYAKQAYHNGKWPAEIDGRILDYIWENTTINTVAKAYDSLYTAVDEDEALRQFLAERGIGDFKPELEQKVLHFMASDVMEGHIRGNMYYQPTLACLARAIDNEDPNYGPTTREMVDWLLYGGGEIETILYNGFDRDGAGGESAPGYSSSWNENFCKVADELIRLGYNITDNPRWRQLVRFPYNLTLAGKYSPRIGDCGGNIHTATESLAVTTILEFGFKHFRDPQCAQLLLRHGSFGNSLWGDTLDRSEVEEVANGTPDQTDFHTRDLGGYGLAVFDSGEGENRRAATMYYGSPDAWHGHHDRLTIAYHAHGRDFLTEMGYPAHWNAKADRFTMGMPSHYIVEIDEQRSANKKSGYLDFFAAGRRCRVVRAHAEAIYPGTAEIYQRTFAMIDEGDDSFLIDLFHVKGGLIHDYLFHGLPFGEFSTEGLNPVSRQEKGTLLGEDIEWGGDKTRARSGYDFLKNVRRHRADSVWSAGWVGRDDCRLAYFMPAFPEVIVCDGEPPVKPDYPETMEFLVVRNPSAESHFPAVISPSRGRDLVLAASFETTESGVTYNVRTQEGLWRIWVGDDAKFDAVQRLSDGSSYEFHAGGGNEKTRYAIESVDYRNNSVRLGRGIDDPSLLVGEVVVIRGNGHSASYTVAEASGNALRFEGPALTGVVEIEDVTAERVATKTRLSGYGTQISARHFPGMVLTTEGLDVGSPIEAYSDGRFELAAPISFQDSNGDGRTLAYFADYAPGYEVRVTHWTEVE